MLLFPGIVDRPVQQWFKICGIKIIGLKFTQRQNWCPDKSISGMIRTTADQQARTINKFLNLSHLFSEGDAEAWTGKGLSVFGHRSGAS
jgi:hypothetical protein